MTPDQARTAIAEAAGWLERGVQPDGRLPVRLRPRGRPRLLRVQLHAARGSHAQPLHARRADRRRGGARGGRAWPAVPPPKPPPPRRLDRLRRARPGCAPGRERAGRGRARPAPHRHRRRERGRAPARAGRLPPRAAAGRRQRGRPLEPGVGAARPRRVVDVRDGPGAVYVRAHGPALPGGGLGRAGAPTGSLRGHAPGRGRRAPAHVPRPLVRLRPRRARAGRARRARGRLRARPRRHPRPELAPGVPERARRAAAAHARRAHVGRGPRHRDRGARPALAAEPGRPAPGGHHGRPGAAPSLHGRPRRRPAGRRREASAFPRPLLARGAWFTEDGYTQMDHVRHPMSGLLATLPLLDGEPAG